VLAKTIDAYAEDFPDASTLGGYVIRDANGQALVYIYSRDSEAEALQAKVLGRDD
jgi:hypothetical protein